MGSCQLHSDTFDLVETYLVVTTVIELRCARAGMVCYGGRLLQRAAVLEVGGDSRRPKTVVAHLGPVTS